MHYVKRGKKNLPASCALIFYMVLFIFFYLKCMDNLERLPYYFDTSLCFIYIIQFVIYPRAKGRLRQSEKPATRNLGVKKQIELQCGASRHRRNIPSRPTSQSG